MKFFHIFALAAVLIVACTPEKPKNEVSGIIQVPLPAEAAVDFDTLLQVEHMIIPELTEGTALKFPYRVFWTDSLFVIFDSGLQKILAFNHDGKFLHFYGQQGSGADDFSELKDVVVYQGKVHAYDCIGHKMLVYDLDGNLLRNIPSKFDFHSFAKADSGYWLYATKKEQNAEGYALIHTDSDLQNVVAGFFPQHPDFINLEHGTNFIIHNQEVFFFWPTSNVVYQLHGDEVTPYATVDFGEKTPNYGYISRQTEESVYQHYMEDNHFYRFRSVHIAGNFMTFVYRRYAVSDVVTPNFAYYNRVTGTTVACPMKMATENAYLRRTFNIGETDDCLIDYSKIGNNEQLRQYVEKTYGVSAPEGCNPAFALCKPMLK
ncbi:MAG: 6-bladed beta-propeller [Bacteroidales bacterium]|nr:6-bladed beta-propeller [Bacteroidales bacterium]